MSPLDQILSQPAFALIRGREADTVTLLGGTRTDLEQLADIPLSQGSEERWDRLVLVPFAQVRERGFQAQQDGTPLTSIEAEVLLEVSLDDLIAELPDVPIEFDDRGGFETSDSDYADVVRRIITDEIGQGEGANLVIGRHYRAKVSDWNHDRALTVLRRLLTRERGAFWTFCIFTGDRYLIGASPERHVSLTAGEVRMNPISGTFRLRGHDTHAARRAALLEFLGVTQAVLVGMSQGGFLSLRCALIHPEVVRALVLIDTQAGLEVEEASQQWDALFNTWIEHGLSDDMATMAEHVVIGQGWPGAAAWRQDWRKITPHNLAHSVAALVQRDDISPRLSEIHVPTLVIHGFDDIAVPTEKSRAMAEALPKAHWVGIANAGHASNLMQPAAVNAAIEEFLAILQ